MYNVVYICMYSRVSFGNIVAIVENVNDSKTSLTSLIGYSYRVSTWMRPTILVVLKMYTGIHGM